MSPPEPTRTGAVVCDLSGLTGADIGTVDVLAQLLLATRLPAASWSYAASVRSYRNCWSCQGWTTSSPSSRWSGSPNSANRWVPRKLVIEVIRPSDISSRWIAHGS